MVSDDKQYEFVSGEIASRNGRIYETRGQFIRVFSAVVGGSIWLSSQKEMASKFLTYEILSDVIVILMTVISCASIWANLKSWEGYRLAQSRLEPSIPKPNFYKASREELILMVVMLLASLLFMIFNPFRQ